jgi:hypothetical protein
MSDSPEKGAADEAREHEREAQRRDPHEESPAGEDEARSPAPVGTDEDPDGPAPPGMGTGNVTG